MATPAGHCATRVVLVEQAHIRPMMGLDGEASVGANWRRPGRAQIAVLGPGGAVAPQEAQLGTRFVAMAGKPYSKMPVYNGPYVD
jgi:hypothetical protein